ncbi:hypothetical protein EVAR_27000_1 [Eumeta japonica]|uniref:Uncharacterized protein n=1 Tax=Eumeta variegata TaxID=151549 RepID=A0A4C1VMU0_EUMVA|nr:hypothetical protein EVAR_27000_1 [Eumeta japonica]
MARHALGQLHAACNSPLTIESVPSTTVSQPTDALPFTSPEAQSWSMGRLVIAQVTAGPPRTITTGPCDNFPTLLICRRNDDDQPGKRREGRKLITRIDVERHRAAARAAAGPRLY